MNLARLPQLEVGWICLAGPMSGWTKDKATGATVRPWITCVLRCDLSEAEGAHLGGGCQVSRGCRRRRG